MTPLKFKNVTNGIAHRRWLCQSNPALSGLITELIGDGFVHNAGELLNLRKYVDDKTVLEQIGRVKLENKERFAALVKKANGIALDPTSIFDVQVKRLHEYKRQHLNALHILAQYLMLKENPNIDFIPRTYIFWRKGGVRLFYGKKKLSALSVRWRM